MKRGFTLGELLIVIIIVGTLASISLPKFIAMIEQGKADEAGTYLRLVRSGEKIYHAENGDYVNCTNATVIRSVLGIELTTENFGFSVTDANETAFLATATRNSNNQLIILDAEGNWSGNATYMPKIQ